MTGVRTATLVVVLVASALLAALELMLQPLYVGAWPAPVGTVIALMSMPWLVRTAAGTFPSVLAAGSPIIVWVVVVLVLGSGSDVLLPATWQSLLLALAALGAGLYALRGVVMAQGRSTGAGSAHG